MHTPISTTAIRERGRYAALFRSRDSDDPELLEAHRRMREEALIAAIQRALKNGPAVTGDVQDRIVGLLSDHADAEPS